MKETLISILSDLYPVFLQGSAPQVLPASFFTIWETTDDGSHYNNKAVSYEWAWDVNFYSQSAALTNTVLLAAKSLLQKNGFIVGGKGRDISVNDPRYTGRAIIARFLEVEANAETEEETNENQNEGG